MVLDFMVRHRVNRQNDAVLESNVFGHKIKQNKAEGRLQF